MELKILRGEVPQDLRSGSGYGDGSGSGYGDGDGDGSGSGSGYGYGYGSGSGSGSGSGYGSGSGSGYGDGDGYWQAVLAPYLKPDSRVAFWLSDAEGRPCNGGRGEPVRVGLVEEIAGPLRLCGSRALHATLEPTKWKGERIWVVALHGEVHEESDKLGALKREFLAEITPGR